MLNAYLSVSQVNTCRGLIKLHILSAQTSLTLGEKLPNIKNSTSDRGEGGGEGSGICRKLTPLFMETLLLLK